MKRHFLMLLLAGPLLCATAHGQVRMKDSSDWWSVANPNNYGPDVKPSNRDIGARNFEIAGIHLDTTDFRSLSTKLGKATIVSRGDGSTSRNQACYLSRGTRSRTYFVFELGEDGSTFYLFTGGTDWKGSNFCVKSSVVSASLGTESGLRLGLSPDQVRAILGSPDAPLPDKLVYSRQIDKKATPAEFEEQRRQYPDKLSDKQAHEKFDFYPVEIYIEARFKDSKLSYLAVSKSAE